MDIGPFKKTYQNRVVLDFPGFSFENKKIYAVIGANGCGKSTLAKILCGAEPADSGYLPLPQQQRLGYMPQQPYAFSTSLVKNVLLGSPDKARAAALISALELTPLINKSARSLSGGETARMALARILMGSHDMLILDEPCASMDVHATMLAEQAITAYREAYAATILLITHSIKQAVRIADELLFLSDGCLLEHGKTSTVISAPASEKTKHFLDFYSL